MEFRDQQAIYMQIADYFASHILENKWTTGEKVPSVRQLAVDLEVNPNTVMRSYTFLQDNEIIYNKRGIGYFVGADAKSIILKMKKQKFVQDDLPEVFNSMKLLDITLKDIEEYYVEWKSKNN